MSIEIRNVEKHFGNFHALRDVSLDIASGELIALLGPSGCGKTTLLRIIAGLETPDAGSIHFSGVDTTDVHVRERNVGFVFQHYALFRHMTVFDNVAFGLRVRPRSTRPSEAQIRDKVMSLLKLVQLDWVAQRYPGQLSGGQRQRIALARALAVEPKVLLLDEPFGALDAKVRKELRRWLRHLHDELDVTSIFVTHDQEEALEVADRVVVINQGRIEQMGTPQEVWDNPASPFVYSFLGDVNLFKSPTSVSGPGGAGAHGDAHHASAHTDTGSSTDLSAGQDTWAYVRPHDLDISRPGLPVEGGGAGGVLARLDRAIVVGAMARLELTPLDSGQTLTTLIEAHIPAPQFRQMALIEGDTVLVTPRRARVFLDVAAGI